jgi:pyroglutamyl-peptidase
MQRVLLTAFEPFDNQARNSSLEVAQGLLAKSPPGVDCRLAVLPVVADLCAERAWSAVEQHQPDFILSLGQSGASPCLRLEDRAVNLDDFSLPDNAGQVRIRQPIIEGAPALLRTQIDVERLFACLRDRGHPVEWSFSAGTFVCNHLYYRLLHRCHAVARPVLFVHLPFLPGQIGPKQLGFVLDMQVQLRCLTALLMELASQRAAAEAG